MSSIKYIRKVLLIMIYILLGIYLFFLDTFFQIIDFPFQLICLVAVVVFFFSITIRFLRILHLPFKLICEVLNSEIIQNTQDDITTLFSTDLVWFVRQISFELNIRLRRRSLVGELGDRRIHGAGASRPSNVPMPTLDQNH